MTEATRLIIAALITVVKCQWNPYLPDLYQFVPKSNEALALDVDDSNEIVVTTRDGLRTTQIFQFRYDDSKPDLTNKPYEIVDIEYLEALKLEFDEGNGELEMTRARRNSEEDCQKWLVQEVPSQPDYKRLQNHEFYERCLAVEGTTATQRARVVWKNCSEPTDAQHWRIHPVTNTEPSLQILPDGYKESVEMPYEKELFTRSLYELCVRRRNSSERGENVNRLSNCD